MYFGQATGHQNQSEPIIEYDRRIRYLDYMENGQRSRGAGFVKMERRDNRCNISLQVSGLYRKDHFTRPLLMLADGEEWELCKLQLADGGIKICLEGLDCKNMNGQGLEYERLAGLRVPISEGKEIQCVWETALVSRMQNVNVENDALQDTAPQNENVQNENTQDMSLQDKNVENSTPENEVEQNQSASNENMSHNKSNLNVPIREVATWDLSRRNEDVREVSTEEYIPGEPAQDADLQDVTASEVPEQEEISSKVPEQEEIMEEQEVQIPETQRQSTQMQETQSQTASKRKANLAAFKEDKWEQLWSVYPHIHPFSDEREYLSFGLSDFVVLPARYYKLVNNSFLLHGFYNFHHLILTRVKGRNGARYFIGVPGNLYQTEKDTAIMFGFEHFECDTEPAGRGDFGYYLIPVEL